MSQVQTKKKLCFYKIDFIITFRPTLLNLWSDFVPLSFPPKFLYVFLTYRLLISLS
jgi:hypothetical protein